MFVVNLLLPETKIQISSKITAKNIQKRTNKLLTICLKSNNSKAKAKQRKTASLSDTELTKDIIQYIFGCYFACDCSEVVECGSQVC